MFTNENGKANKETKNKNKNQKQGGDASQLPCKHFFHDLCVLEWFKNHNTCPMCRFELKTADYAYESQKWKNKTQNQSGNQESEEVKFHKKKSFFFLF